MVPVPILLDRLEKCDRYHLHKMDMLRIFKGMEPVPFLLDIPQKWGRWHFYMMTMAQNSREWYRSHFIEETAKVGPVQLLQDRHA
jgi:hypothetical protein